MTDSTAPAPLQRVPVVCVKCGAKSDVWRTPEQLAEMEITYSEPDAAYLHVCGCQYQTVSADAPLNMPRSHDPESTLHHRRTSGGYHTQGWRAR